MSIEEMVRIELYSKHGLITFIYVEKAIAPTYKMQALGNQQTTIDGWVKSQEPNGVVQRKELIFDASKVVGVGIIDDPQFMYEVSAET